MIITFSLAVLTGNIMWLVQFQWIDLIYALLVAVIASIIIVYVYKKHSTRSKILETTVTPPPHSSPSMAKLILKEKNEFIIKDYEKIFGREDFLGVISEDKLRFIGKKHFKITKKNDGFYLKDLDTKNGTQINGKNIKGLNSIKLDNEDIISVANVLNIKYIEEMV